MSSQGNIYGKTGRLNYDGMTLDFSGSNPLNLPAGDIPASNVAEFPAATAVKLQKALNSNRSLFYFDPVSGQYISLTQMVFDVRDFGAIGDGVADDAPAINACIEAAPAGSIIDFSPRPNGAITIYRITSAIKLRMGLRYRGRGGGAIGSQSVYQGVVIRPDAAIWAFDRDASQNYVLSGIAVENLNIQWANAAVLGGFNWDGIAWSSITNVGIEPSQSTAVRRYGVKLNTTAHGCYYNNFSNVHLRGNGRNRVTLFYATGYAHENKVFGGSAQDCDIPVILEGVDGWHFDGLACDGSFDVCYKFIGASQNRVWGGRAESYPKANLNVSRAANVVTVEHDGTTLFTVGQWVYLSDSADASFNHPYVPLQIASVVDDTHFTYNRAGANASTTAKLYFGSVASFDANSKGNAILYTNDQQVAKAYTEGTRGSNVVAFNVGGSLAKWTWNKGLTNNKGLQMGEWPPAPSYWFLAAGGADETQAGTYSFLWDLAGGLIINAPAGQVFSLRKNNNEKAKITDNGFGIGSNGTELKYVAAGSGQLAAGTVTIADINVTANSKIVLTRTAAGAGVLRVSAKTPGVSFAVTSSDGADAGTFDYAILNT